MSCWWALLVLVASVSLGCSDQTDVPPTGRLLYVQHCASCHGLGGEGDGPIASSLTRSPSDLTVLSLESGGRFDEALVTRTIDGRREVLEHGPREMPVWGATFEKELEGERHGSYSAMLHVRALTDYVRSIQRER